MANEKFNWHKSQNAALHWTALSGGRRHWAEVESKNNAGKLWRGYHISKARDGSDLKEQRHFNGPWRASVDTAIKDIDKYKEQTMRSPRPSAGQSYKSLKKAEGK